MTYVVTSPGGTVTMTAGRRDPAAVKTSEFHRLVPDNGARHYFCGGAYEITGRYNEHDQIRRFAIEQLLTPLMLELRADWSRRNGQLVANNNAKRNLPSSGL